MISNVNLTKINRNIAKVGRDIRYRVLGQPWLSVQARDCFLCSWPRSGNTWIRHTIYFYHVDNTDPTMEMLENFSPTIDVLGFQSRLRALGESGPRFIKSHEVAASYFLKGRIAYIVRDGRDAAYSYYNYYTKMKKINVSFDVFLRRMLQNKIRYRSWHYNVATWTKYESSKNILFIRYEDILEDPNREARKILEHFGVVVDENRLIRALDLSSIDRVNKTFQTMTQAQNTAGGQQGFKGGLGGGSGGWRRRFTTEQVQLFNRHAGDILERFGYHLGNV